MSVDLIALTEKKISELAKQSLTIQRNENDLMEIVRVHYKFWEQRLFPYCKLVGVSHVDVVLEILHEGGVVVLDRAKLRTYLNRAKKVKGSV